MMLAALKPIQIGMRALVRFQSQPRRYDTLDHIQVRDDLLVAVDNPVLQLPLCPLNFREASQKPIGTTCLHIQMGRLPIEFNRDTYPLKRIKFTEQGGKGSFEAQMTDVFPCTFIFQAVYSHTLALEFAKTAGYSSVAAYQQAMHRAYGPIHPDYPIVCIGYRKTT